MAFRDLAGPTAAERWTAYQAPATGGRWRGPSRWDDRPLRRRSLDRRPPPPSQRMGRAHIPRAAFLMLAIGWASAAALLLIVALAVRGWG